MDLEVKDVLYYNDLMYELKKIAGLEQEINQDTEERILKRHQCIIEEQETGPFRFLNRISDFQQDLFEIIISISNKAGVGFRSTSEISKYPEFVKEALSELEKIRDDLDNNEEKILTLSNLYL